MQVLAIANQKGGCGKTTTAVNLASVLAARAHRVLLVDLDPQSHCAAGLGVPEENITYSTIDLLLDPDPRPLDPQAFANRTWEVSHGLRLLPSTVRLAAAEAPGGGLMEQPDRDRRLAAAVKIFEDLVDFCIIDCPPTIGLLTFNALRAADEVLVPVETGFFSARGAERQWSTLRAMATRLQRPIAARVLPNLVREASSLDLDLLRSIRTRFESSVCPTVIRDHTIIREATGLGRPIVEHAPESPARADYERLADWLLSTPPGLVSPATPEEMAQETPGARTENEEAIQEQVASPRTSTRMTEMVQRLGDPQGPDAQVGASVTPGRLRIRQPAVLGEKISLTGDFNQWHHVGLSLQSRPEAWGDAVVGIDVPVSAGTQRYRLIVDGVEIPDPANPEQGIGPDDLPCSVVEVPSMVAESEQWTQNATPSTS
ncbi:MAG: AAA family ATPase [Phycisphaerales bacterium]|nr:AAA family ATPase [Phycisphaerales bacterium]